MKPEIETLETLSYQDCSEKIDKPLLIEQMRYVLENSEFYSEKYKVCGLGIEQAMDIHSFESLPFTNKNEVVAEQEKYPPFGRLGTKNNRSNLRRVHMTSGSTGRPLYVVLTENDLIATIEAGRRAFRCAGLTPQDTVIHCLNYCLWAGGLTDHLNLEATGATVIPFGVGNSKNLIQTIFHLHPTAISCTPSYLKRLEYLLKEEFDKTPSDLGLKKAFLGGEGGLQNPIVRSRIEEIWQIKAIDANYGMADVLSIFGSECDARQGLHFHGQGLLHMELIDPVNDKNLNVKNGQVGEMVLTNLRREAQPLVRYKSGDLIKIVSTDLCVCGRSSLRFLVIGRTDDMITVRGVNLFPNALANIFSGRPDWFSGEYEIVLDSPPPFERILLRVELASPSLHRDMKMIESYILDTCRDEYSFTPRLELIPFGEFPRTDGKTRRIRKLFE